MILLSGNLAFGCNWNAISTSVIKATKLQAIRKKKKQQQPQQSTEDFTNITVVLTRKRNWYSNAYSGS